LNQSLAPISRESLSLPPATVSSIVSLLMKSGIARETGYGESTGGRPPSDDRVQPQAFYLAGVDLGVSKIIAVVTDLEGNVVSDTRQELDVHLGRGIDLVKPL